MSKKPNILILWGDDIGYWNISANNRGMMGYRTPHIDRLATQRENKPFFLWWNSTHMHFRTHLKPGWEGKSGQGFYNDAMVYHDETVGTMLNKLDELKIADDTPSFSTRPTMAPTTILGQMLVSPRFEARRIRTGKVPLESPHSLAGQENSQPEKH